MAQDQLTKVIMGYYLRNSRPQIHVQYRDDEDNVVVEHNAPQVGDTPLADEEAYQDEVDALQLSYDTLMADRDAQAIIDDAALEALRTSGMSNLTAGNPLTSDEAYVVMYGKLPPLP